MKRLFALAIALGAPLPAIAQSDSHWVQLKNEAPVTVRADRAYILYRLARMPGMIGGMDVVLLRDPSQAELSAYFAARAKALADAIEQRERERRRAAEKRQRDGKTIVPPEFTEAEFRFRFPDATNLRRGNHGNQYATSPTENTYLIEVTPGSYVFAGVSHKMFTNTQTCMCMGTVRFDAKPGVITDLGQVLIDDVATLSQFPELAPLTNRGPRINGFGLLMAAAIRPFSDGTSIPATLSGVPRTPAEYRAVGKFPNRYATSVYRLAPMANVLAYEEDRVIDARTGRDAIVMP